MNTIDLILSPDLIPSYPPTSPTVYVVIDILRASSTIVAALSHGATAIRPLEHVEQAEALAKAGHLVGAERNALRCPFAQLGNDPLEYTPDIVAGKEIYLTTTNGTRTLHRCMDMGGEVVVGAFTNINTIIDFCRDKNVLAVCAGWKGKVSLEDSMYAAALVDRLGGSHHPESDAARMIHELYTHHHDDLISYIQTSDHYARLVSAQKAEALDYCITEHTYDVLPYARREQNNQIVITNDYPHE